ncbi:MAG TPA: SEC-C domain-containing protein [Thermoanaerobaculia bacterium]|jgi:tetratricopeptide (TPR) repeat protein
MDDDDLFDEEDLFEDEESEESFVGFLRDAVAEALESEDGGAFLAWMREEAPFRVPELFEELPDEQARRGLASELGRMLWNAIPLPDNGYRPRPLPRPERNDPCPCGSGRKYKRCCAEWADAVPVLDPEVLWLLVIERLTLEEAEELGRSGKMPRALAGELATVFLDDGDAERALALVQPLFERPERLDERDAPALNALLEACDELELREEKQEAVDRLSRKLEPGLRAVLWENLVRSHAVEGEMEQAWAALEKARKDDPESPALGPLEVSLLLAEGRTREAGERARSFRERFRRDPEAITEAGLEFLDKVAHDPAGAQLEFSLGKETAAGIRRLRELLADAEPPSVVYEIAEVEGDPGAGQLVTPEALRQVEEVFAEVFQPVLLEVPGCEGEEDEEDLDPWEEEQAERWLSFLLSHPAALDSVNVLGDVADAVVGLVTDRCGSLEIPLLRPLLDRGLTIVERSLAARPEIRRLPEDAETNASALVLLLAAAAQANRLGEPERALELLKRIRVLNPAVIDADAR